MSDVTFDGYDPYRDPNSSLYDPYADPDSPLYDPYLDPDGRWEDPPDPEPQPPPREPVSWPEEPSCSVEEVEPDKCIEVCTTCIQYSDGSIECEITYDDTPCPRSTPIC